MPSLSKTLETYFSAARSVITSLSAIPWLDVPDAMSSSDPMGVERLSRVAQTRFRSGAPHEALAVEVLTALGERHGAVRTQSCAGGAFAGDDPRRGLALATSGRMVRQRRHNAGSHPPAPPGGPALRPCYKVNARRVSAAGLAAPQGGRSNGVSRPRRISRVADSSHVHHMTCD